MNFITKLKIILSEMLCFSPINRTIEPSPFMENQDNLYRKVLITKLKNHAEVCKLFENKDEYKTLMSAIKVIEELIYLNDCLMQDVKDLFEKIEQFRKSKTSSITELMDEVNSYSFRTPLSSIPEIDNKNLDDFIEGDKKQ